jgi:uncharacterized protein
MVTSDGRVPAMHGAGAAMLDRELLRSQAPTWAAAAVERFCRDMGNTSPPFPCTFGIDAYERNTLRFVFVHEPFADEGLDELARSLSAYLAISSTLGKVTSFLAFLNTAGRLEGLADHQRMFWHVLQHLHDVDRRPWPGAYPMDPADPNWEFCFEGEAMFVVCATPAHVARRSRQAGCMVVTFQPRFVFRGLEHDTPAGNAARAIIRRRVVSYDDIPIYPFLAGYGQLDAREWRQYFLPDDNDHILDRCPLHLSARGHAHMTEESE